MANIICKKVSGSAKDLLNCTNAIWQTGTEMIETAATPWPTSPLRI